jgi:predicted metal-binding protein
VTKQLDVLVNKALELGATDAKLLDSKAIIYDKRSFLKCRFGCNRWGKFWTCQPNIGLTIEEFQEMVKNYSQALVIQSVNPKISQEVTLEIEKKAMLDHGAMFAFALVLCVLCEECAYPEPCRHPHLARPSMDGLGVDIAKTIEPLGLKVEFDPEGQLLPAWYSMVLLE